MEPARQNIEEAILEQNFAGRYQWFDLKRPGKTRLQMRLGTSSGQAYTLDICLPRDYPNSLPTVYIAEPDPLRDHRGDILALQSPSHPMHLLQPRGTQVQLCHYKAENWHPNVTLYKVVLKCLIWLEAFQNHLINGRPMVHFLGT